MLEYVLIELPTSTKEYDSIMELLSNDKLVAGCDGGDDHNGKIVVFPNKGIK